MSPSSEVSSPSLSSSFEYSPEERRILLQLAHRSIASAFHNIGLDLTPPSEHLAQGRGVFTTLHLHGKLRGCIGYVTGKHSLYRAVAETAQAAAFDDPRFPAVSAEELPDLKAEISVLSPLQPIKPEQVVIGRHGLVVSRHERRGLLLPQVPVAWGWDRETFLAQTCLKAGLPPDVWQHGAELQAFTAEVFSDTE